MAGRQSDCASGALAALRPLTRKYFNTALPSRPWSGPPQDLHVISRNFSGDVASTRTTLYSASQFGHLRKATSGLFMILSYAKRSANRRYRGLVLEMIALGEMWTSGCSKGQ